MSSRYKGDINGKFWFAVQDHRDAIHFGGEEILYKDKAEYIFGKEDLSSVQSKILEIQEQLGENYDKLENYFRDIDYYCQVETMYKFGIDSYDELKKMMELYARIILGLEIEDSIGKTGKCYFWSIFW
jgi:gamma-glutamylcyclotransferase (GGCT)/AIG2-like uncharacterized protein YtfP